MTIEQFKMLTPEVQKSIKNDWKVLHSTWRVRENGKNKRYPIDWDTFKKRFYFATPEAEAEMKFGVELWNHNIASNRKRVAMALRHKEQEEPAKAQA